MNISGITWRGETADDFALLRDLPPEIIRVLGDTNGFIVHEGALHVRGACLTPEWHSLRAVWQGANAFHILYDNVEPTDIPFAQDQLGDQFLLRQSRVLRLSAETGELETLADSLPDFFHNVCDDIEGFLSVGLKHKLQPGQLLHAYPPFCFQESGTGTSLQPLPAKEVILLHADLARHIRDVPEGSQVEIKLSHL